MTEVSTTTNDDSLALEYARLGLLSSDLVSPDIEILSRKNNAIFLQALNGATGSQVAESIGVSEATISRFKGGALAFACLVLAALGLKIVPAHALVFIQPEEYK